MHRRTVIFTAFILLFFIMTGYLTYYSGFVYLNTLPVVDSVLPQPSGSYANGRMTYYIPAEAVYRRSDGTFYIQTARYVADDLGERYQVAEVSVRILEKTSDSQVCVDGIVWEEAIILDQSRKLQEGDSIRL